MNVNSPPLTSATEYNQLPQAGSTRFQETGTEQDEAGLIAAVRLGDLDAFNRLVLNYQARVFNHAHWILGERENAEDITQETFIRAFRRFNQFRGGSFRSWILKIATNLCYDQMRYVKRHPVQPLEPTIDDEEQPETPLWITDPRPLPEAEVEAAELRETLQRALNDLPAPYRSAVSLIDIQELSYIEAAAILGVPTGTVKSRLARGRSLLRDTLSNAR